LTAIRAPMSTINRNFGLFHDHSPNWGSKVQGFEVQGFRVEWLIG
jgi:hypothetical protein